MVQGVAGLFLRDVMDAQGRKPGWVMEHMHWSKKMFLDRMHGEVILTTDEVSRLRRLLIERGPALPLETLYDPSIYQPARTAVRRGLRR